VVVVYHKIYDYWDPGSWVSWKQSPTLSGMLEGHGYHVIAQASWSGSQWLASWGGK